MKEIYYIKYFLILKNDMNEMKKIIDSIMNNSNSISNEPNNYLKEDKWKKFNNCNK